MSGPFFVRALEEDAQSRFFQVSNNICPEVAFVVKCQELWREGLMPDSAGDTIHCALRRPLAERIPGCFPLACHLLLCDMEMY